ncbi:barstar family protein [Actinoplanes sp. NPDC049596]|uniref:barstar family protein n=1 Tax=unclassified Actinoplanes TaxID=2626549 RepID=UPI00341DBB4A
MNETSPPAGPTADDEVSPRDSRWRWAESVPLRWLLVDESAMDGRVVAVAAVADIEGLFADSPGRGTTLLGCLPYPPLRRALDALAEGGSARHRRAIDAFVYGVDRNGAAHRVIDCQVRASVSDVRPSSLSADLVDVTLDGPVSEPMPAAARPIWELWHAGGPAEPGLWAGYDRELRHLWSGAALAHHRADEPDQPAGGTYQLEGRHVTDVEGFYCALGEAVNGPGGYFGWNGDALHDCLRGGWGAEAPFRLIWRDAEVARTHLAEGFDRILQWLAEDRVEVELR